jgi:hypothetical protein
LCHKKFPAFTQDLTHEIVELLTDPGGTGIDAHFPDYAHEVADLCDNDFTVVSGFSLARYAAPPPTAIPGAGCQPRLDPPPGSVAQTWVLG